MKTEVKQFKELVGNKIFSVEFTKKDGSLRKMVCRLGVKKHLRGGELSYNPEDFNYLVVFDLQSEEYRTINVNTLKSFTFEGVKYEL
jgi:hypothetical protein